MMILHEDAASVAYMWQAKKSRPLELAQHETTRRKPYEFWFPSTSVNVINEHTFHDVIR
jgi:hypothetical protein